MDSPRLHPVEDFMTTHTALVTLFVLAGITACGGGGDDGVNGPPPAPAVTTVEISPNPATVFMGDTIQLIATAKDQSGNTMTGKRIVWASDAPSVATVDSLGLVVAIASGISRISATVEGKTGSVVLTSTGPGTTGAVTGSASIGDTGGSVQATLPGGGTLGLTIPPAALRSSMSITLEPIVPAPGDLAAFRLTPAGVRLDKPATLVIKVSAGAKLRPNSMLVFDQGGQHVPVAGVVNTADGTLTASLTALGASDTGATTVSSRTRSAFANAGGSGSATGRIANLTLFSLFHDAQFALDLLIRAGTIAQAENVQRYMEALMTQGAARVTSDSRFAPLSNQWTSTVCGFAQFAFNALSNFNFVSDYRGLERVIVSVVHWQRVAAEMDAFLRPVSGNTCFNALPNPQTRINSKLSALEPSITTDLNGFALDPSPRDSSFFVDRLRPLIDLSASLGFVGFDPEALIVRNIVIAQLARMRERGHVSCRLNGSQEIQGRLARNIVTGSLPGLTLAELQTDIEQCGMTVKWELQDSTNVSVNQGELGARTLPGQAVTSASATLIGNGQLKLSRVLMQALLCPAPASANNEQLEIVAGRNTTSLTRVAVLSPSNSNQYLSSSSLLIGTDTLRRVAGLAPTDSGLVTVVVRRTGGVCSGMLTITGHSNLATLRLTLARPNQIYFKNFTTGPAGSEWSTAQMSTSPSGQRFLGELGNTSTTLTLDSLPVHSQLILEFDIYIIDSWNGNGGIGNAAAPDIIEISVVGGAVLKRTTFSNKPSDVQAYPGDYPGGVNAAGTGSFGKGTLGYDVDPDHFGDSSYRLRLTFNHVGANIAIRFRSQQTSGQNERWGIDNVRLTRAQ
jgi:hypothetical protein